MQYRKIIATVACAMTFLLSAGLMTGCGAAFAGFQVGGKEELQFVCDAPYETASEGVSPQEYKAETSQSEPDQAAQKSRADSGESVSSEETSPEKTESGDTAADGKVDLNTADLETLMTLNGIGETRAQAIIDYRTREGAFVKIEDIMEIPGIKEGIFSRIRDQIVVR